MSDFASSRSLTNASEADARQSAPDLQVIGNTDCWQVLSKAASPSQGWMRSTKAMEIPGVGCLVQVSTLQGGVLAEALTFVPGAQIVADVNDGRKLV